MKERSVPTPGPLFGNNYDFKEAVCIQTDKIYDSCKDKDCIENARVYLTQSGQDIIDRAINVKVRKAEIIWVFTDVEAVPFNRGFYTVDLRFFFRITLDVFLGVSRPVEVEGLATFNKKVILFGSEGQAKIFSTKYSADAYDSQSWQKTNLPKAIVECVDPIALGAKLVDVDDCCKCNDCCDIDLGSVPNLVCNAFDEILCPESDTKRVYVSLGLFSIIKLERNVQLLIPAYDFCIPCKECVGATDDDPCDLFSQIEFPVDEFYPPQICDFLQNNDSGFISGPSPCTQNCANNARSCNR